MFDKAKLDKMIDEMLGGTKKKRTTLAISSEHPELQTVWKSTEAEAFALAEQFAEIDRKVLEVKKKFWDVVEKYLKSIGKQTDGDALELDPETGVIYRIDREKKGGLDACI